MIATDAFVVFCQRVLSPEKARRYEALAASPRGQKKFLECLCHEFDDAILPSCELGSDYSSLWGRDCFVFIGPREFGVEFSSFERAYEELSIKDSWLILLVDGSAGVYRPESRWDAERMIAKR